MIKKTKSVLTPEMIGKLAEKGINALRLSRKQKQELLTSGLEEFMLCMICKSRIFHFWRMLKSKCSWKDISNPP